MRRQLLCTALLTVTLFVAAPTPNARANGVACAVRLREPSSARTAKATALQAVLSTAGSVQARPLLAAGHVAASADADVLFAANARREHPFAAWYVLVFESSAQRERAMQALRTLPVLEAVEPVRTLSIPESGRVGAGTPIRTELVPWNVQRVRAPEALGMVQPDSSIIVAVIDSGADLSHPGLQRTLWRNDDGPGNASPDDDAFDQNGNGFVEDWERDDDDDNGFVDDLWGYDFTDAPGQGGVGDVLQRDALPQDENGHGTHVAGIIAADGDLQGVAPFVQLMVLRAAFNRIFAGAALETDDAAAAIVYAVDNGARILNLSFGDNQDSRLIREALDYAWAHDVVVVAAAGNGSTEETHYPSAYPGVIGVGASNRNDRRASFSNRGAGVEVVAPGEDAAFPGPGILSLGLDGGIQERRGTSMSAPHVAGVAAIVLSRADRPSAQRARALIVASARRNGTADWSRELGHGIVDALAAVSTNDDVVVQALAPAQPYRLGRFRLVGTVLSGDAPRWHLAVRPLDGTWNELVSNQRRQVVADTLVSVPLIGVPEGDWEYRLAVELGDGELRESRGAFVVDPSPPVVQNYAVSAVWRDSQPRWLVTTQSDDPVRLSVLEATTGAPLFSSPGFDRHVLLEAPAVSDAVVGWRIALENASGASTTLDVPRPVALPPWPGHAHVDGLETGVTFRPEAVVGNGPAGGVVVWGRSALGPAHMQARSLQAGRLVVVHDTGIQARPVAYADVNGDGASDLLYQDNPTAPGAANIHWLVTRATDAFPDSLAGSVSAARVLGFFDLDDDPALETLLSTEDQLFLYDDLVGREPVRVQSLDNPSQGSFNVFGSDAAVGDIDSDGRREIVCGDAEGFISIFERSDNGEYRVERVLDSGGTYAYQFATLPEGGFLVGRQRTRDVAGDGFETVIYDFINYVADGMPLHVRSFVARLNALDAGVSTLRSSASGDDYVVLANAGHVYLARGATEPREHVSTLAAAARLPAIADFDADGRLEIVVGTASGADVYRFYEEIRGPHDLRSESLGPTSVRLRWQASAGAQSRVQRDRGSGFETLGVTSAAVWVDSTLQAFARTSYRIQAIVAGEVRGTSNTVIAQAQPRPRLRSVEVSSASRLRLRFTNALHPEPLLPRRVRVRDALTEHEIVALALSEHGRALDVVVAGGLRCGDVHVEVDSLRDEYWGLLDPPFAAAQTARACEGPAFHVVRVAALQGQRQGFRVEFSRAPHADALDVATYRVQWNAENLELQTVQQVDARRFDLLLVGGASLVGHGIAYEVHVAETLRASDGAELADAGTVHRVYVDGVGATRVFAYPNPARRTDHEVVFADAAADTRIRIYSLEGGLVRELVGARGGGLRWDLRSNDGGTVSSGVYVFVARDARGTTRGSVAVLR